jgi:signal peptidase I
MEPTLHPYGEIVLIDKWSVRRVGVQDGCIGSERAAAARQRQEQWEQQAAQQRNNKEKRHAAAKANNNNKGKEEGGGGNDDKETSSDGDLDTDCPWHEDRISVTQHYQMAQNASRWQFYKTVVWKQFTSPLSIGDVVVVQHPTRRGTICKRVLGLPGDTVVLPRRYAASWLQQQQQQQPSSSSAWKSSSNTTLAVIPNGHVWLEGDNPANSSDSRYYGPIPMALIQGRVLFRVWPLRGKAWMHRGAPPIHAAGSNGGSSNVGFTIFPAGYEGQRIVKKP